MITKKKTILLRVLTMIYEFYGSISLGRDAIKLVYFNFFKGYFHLVRKISKNQQFDSADFRLFFLMYSWGTEKRYAIEIESIMITFTSKCRMNGLVFWVPNEANIASR